ncbi:hypothetical protein Nepgr_009103 [Nepenthes gracilis]|uniref:Uncharacterized protein n=1 Tax=Nepenthes gracilis TaxID=150966 RepID=A0AAD3S9R5_NEPGR|nr:hypothetical protein Nepgr_009103 [Nepenthes gracilis]
MCNFYADWSALVGPGRDFLRPLFLAAWPQTRAAGKTSTGGSFSDEFQPDVGIVFLSPLQIQSELFPSLPCCFQVFYNLLRVSLSHF